MLFFANCGACNLCPVLSGPSNDGDVTIGPRSGPGVGDPSGPSRQGAQEFEQCGARGFDSWPT